MPGSHLHLRCNYSRPLYSSEIDGNFTLLSNKIAIPQSEIAIGCYGHCGVTSSSNLAFNNRRNSATLGTYRGYNYG